MYIFNRRDLLIALLGEFEICSNKKPNLFACDVWCI